MAASLSITNQVLTGGTTWDAVAIPAGAFKATVRLRSASNTAKVSLAATGTPFVTIQANGQLVLEAMSPLSGNTLHINGTGSDVAEIVFQMVA